jgi:peptidyl-tRNA hydrolase
LRIGIGRSEAGNSVSDHVLGPFLGDESKQLESVLTGARDAVLTILTEGSKVGMNRFNRKKIMS